VRRAFALGLLLLAAGCTPAAADADARTVEISIHHSRFLPAIVDAEAGETIRFVVRNADPIDHEFLVGDRGVQLAHERGIEAYHPPRPGEVTVPAGRTVVTTYTFGERDLEFACHLPGHWAYGMSGLVRIA
jgi:uncharacterized cupredoxin-like copper-binding protein